MSKSGLVGLIVGSVLALIVFIIVIYLYWKNKDTPDDQYPIGGFPRGGKWGGWY